MAGARWRHASIKATHSMKDLTDVQKKQKVLDSFKQRKNLREEFSDFFDETSFTALVRIYKAKSIAKRVMWTVLVLAMMSYLGVQCYWLLNKYFSYPMEVKLDLKASPELEFPSVTICNLNPIRQEFIHDPLYKSLETYAQADTSDMLYSATLDNWQFTDVCTESQWRCSNGRCIEHDFVCDGYDDCLNNDDETDCDNKECGETRFKCASTGICMTLSTRCDGTIDCSDGSDEQMCQNVTCTDGYVLCNNTGRCIYYTWVCDHYADCLDGEDELSCPDKPCPSYYTSRCNASNVCLYEGAVCDGYNNCPDGEDEQNCTYVSGSSSMVSSTTTANPMRRKRSADDDVVSDDEDTRDDADQAQFTKNPHSPRDQLKGRYNDLLVDLEKSQEYRRLQAGWDELKTGLKEGKVSEDEYNSFVDRMKVELKDRVEKTKKQRTQSKELHRHKRSAHGGGSDERTEGPERNGVDWTKELSNASFNKWDALDSDTNGSSISEQFYDVRDNEYLAALTYAYITAQIDPAVVEQSGNKIKDMLAGCKFEGYQCSPRNFTYFHNHKYGNCYTFHSKDSERTLFTRFPGPSQGLNLELFVQQKSYLPELSTEAGFRVLIHKRGSMPFPEDEGISIQPGKSTYIGIRQTSISRLPPPHGVCADKGLTRDDYQEALGTDYSKLSCMKSCYQRITEQRCGCRVTFYYIALNSSYPVCNMTDRTVEKCVSSLSYNYPNQFADCDKLCPSPCEETTYDLTYSMAQWPSEKYESYMTQKMCQVNSEYNKVDSEDEFAKLLIYYRDLIYTHVEQQEAYESMNLISDLGGQLGLWLGLSAITIGELCSFILSISRSLSAMAFGKENKQVHAKTPITHVKPATLEEMYNDLCPESEKNNPPPEAVMSKTSTKI